VSEITTEVHALARAIAAELAPLLLTAQSSAVSSSGVSRATRRGKKRDFAAEIEAHLGSSDAATAPEIARAIRARDAEVREALRTDGRFVRVSTPADRSAKATLWFLTSSASGLGPASGTSAGSEAL